MSNETLKTKLEIKPTEPPSDHRGSSVKLWDVSNDGSRREVGLLFQTFKGNMRGGDYHSTTQYDVVLTGGMKVTFGSPFGENSRVYNPVVMHAGSTVKIDPLISHIFEAKEQNTIMFDQRVQPSFAEQKDADYWGPTNTRFDSRMRKLVMDFKAITDIDSEKKDYLVINGNTTSAYGTKYQISQGNLKVEVMEVEKHRDFEIKFPSQSNYLYLYLVKGTLNVNDRSGVTDRMKLGDVIQMSADRKVNIQTTSEEKPILLYWSIKR